jgi:NitT/TauT family transport system ATP-binding protein
VTFRSTPDYGIPDSRRGTAVRAGQAVAKLEMRGISIAYGDVSVIAGLDLAVTDGEFVTLIGASGCGKTTLLSVIAGFLGPTAGEVTLSGRPITAPGADRAMVFQDDAVFPWSTVLDNVAYGLRFRGLRKAERRQRADELVRLVGLDGWQAAYPRELSGGMRKRVDLARALALEPEILLMDEPFAALDAITKERLQEEFQRIRESRSMTVVFVTHDIEEALFLSDRVVLMGLAGGRILAETSVPFGRPRTPETRTDPRLQDIRSTLVAALRREMSADTRTPGGTT